MSQKMQDDIYRPQIGDKSTPRPQPDYEDGDVFIFNQFRDISAKKTIALPLNIIIICTQGRMQLDVNARTLVVESSNILICPTNTILSNELFSSAFECKVMGITAMTKQLGKKRFDELLGGLIVKPEGKPVLVPDTDKRAEYNTAATDFKMEE